MFCFSLDTAHGEAGITGVVREGGQRAGKLRSPGRAAPMVWFRVLGGASCSKTLTALRISALC